MMRRIFWVGLAAAALGLFMPGCSGGDIEAETPPQDRMRVVTLDPADVKAIQADRFYDFREALVAVRLKESQRPKRLIVPSPVLT